MSDVQKIQYKGWGQMANTEPNTVFDMRPTSSTVFSVHHEKMVL